MIQEDFDNIAKILLRSPTLISREKLVIVLAVMFSYEYKNFDCKKFIEDCGINNDET